MRFVHQTVPLSITATITNEAAHSDKAYRGKVAKPLTWLVGASALICMLAASHSRAQTATREPSESPDEAVELDAVVVTARAGAGRLAKREASYAITVIDEEQLRLENPSSTAELLKAIPGFWVESSGGEASNNIQARGIPRGGYSSIALYEDGLPIQHDPGLGWLNADQSFRLDESIHRVEAVRGGPASVFASNAPGGIVNFITRKPGDEAEGVVRSEIGDYDHHRVDFWYGGPLAEGWGAYASGFYRSNDGVRDPGFTANKGGQIRIGVSRAWDRGTLDLNYKHIDDSVAFFLPVPILSDDGEIREVPGFNANFGNLAGPETALLSFRNVGGPFEFDLTRGTDVQLSQWTARLNIDVDNDWELQAGLRYRDSQIQRNGLFPTGSLESASVRSARLLTAARAFHPTATGVRLRYVNPANETFDPVNANGNGLVVSANALAVSVPLKEFITDARIVRKFSVGSQTHDLAFGAYFADYQYEFDRYMSTVQLDVRNNARLLDAIAVDATGAVVGRITENGHLRYGSLFDNARGQSRTVALYASNEWQVTPALRIDTGLRWEQAKIEGSAENRTTVDLGVLGTLADNQVITGNGVFTPFGREYSDVSWTMGANWQFSRDLGVFTRYTDTYRMPNASDFVGNPLRTDDIVEPIRMAEGGLKFGSPLLDVFATAFFTEFEGVRFTDNIFDQNTNSFRQVTAFADTRTLGLEVEAEVRPIDWFDLRAAITWQDPKYEGFVFTEVVNGRPVQRDFSGRQLIRVPEFGARIVPGVNLLNGAFRGQVEFEYYSDRFADVANTQELPSYWVLNASASYDVTHAIRVTLNGTNLTNEIGLTEGNPRAGQFVAGDAGARFILARPILGRTLRLSVSYRF